MAKIVSITEHFQHFVEELKAGGPLKPGFWLEWGCSYVTDLARLTNQVVLMSWGLKRFHQSGQSHFVTFCCYQRRGCLQQMQAAESSSQRWSECAAVTVSTFMAV